MNVPDFAVALQEDTFTFLIGPNETKFNIHPGVLRSTSEPLHTLVANGKMQEAVEKIARLSEVEEHTFSRYCEYAYNVSILTAYTGNSGNALQPYDFDIPEGLEHFYCRHCGINRRIGNSKSANGQCFPFCSQNCKDQMQMKTEHNISVRCARCGNYPGGNMTGMPSKSSPILCYQCEEQLLPEDSSLKKFSAEFRLLKFNVGAMLHDRFHKQLSYVSPSDHSDDNLSTHAQVYVFAEIYLIQELKEICLHKLHRDLLNFLLDDDSIDEVVHMIAYTYQNTSNNDDGTEGTGSALRKLVTMYVADQVQQLMEYPEFRIMLSEGGPLVADVMAGVVKKLPAAA